MVQRPGAVALGGCTQALRPARQVVDGVGQDPEWLTDDEVVEPCQVVVVVAPPLERRQQRQPGDRRRGHRRLTDAPPERDGLLGTVADRGEVAGQVVAEAEPLQAVDHRRDRTGLPRP